MFLYTVKNITKLAKMTTNHRSHRKHRDSIRKYRPQDHRDQSYREGHKLISKSA